ncbi:nuclear transport factor 2 family protein [Mycolicibacterium palauense]|uniref:nuclear transport factor 2 family protein n=1 Tax=Mycolicibacterium palauense TaxID=2034511 RepID=UPI000BFEEA6A|nr:nuclear transport factor 2 family protein [Mycolicibacterium palauense]
MVAAFPERVRIVTEFLDAIGNLDFDGAGRHLAENAIMDLPFVDGLPALEGRSAIVGQLATTIPQMFERMNFTYDRWYDVRGAETLIAEYHSECPTKGHDGTYRNRYITIFGFDGDKITLYKEYLNPVSMMAAAVPAEPVGDGAR